MHMQREVGLGLGPTSKAGCIFNMVQGTTSWGQRGGGYKGASLEGGREVPHGIVGCSTQGYYYRD